MARERYVKYLDRYVEREPIATGRALAALRSGSAGELREAIRCALVVLIGHRDCRAIPRGTRIPHWFPRDNNLSDPEQRDLARVAYDGLLQLGYDAAADILANRRRREAVSADPFFEHAITYLHIRAREALENLEAGPPSEIRDGYAFFRTPMYRFRGSQVSPNRRVFIVRAVNSARWIRYAEGRGISDRSDTVYAEGHYKTLAAAKEGWNDPVIEEQPPARVRRRQRSH